MACCKRDKIENSYRDVDALHFVSPLLWILRFLGVLPLEVHRTPSASPTLSAQTSVSAVTLPEEPSSNSDHGGFDVTKSGRASSRASDNKGPKVEVKIGPWSLLEAVISLGLQAFSLYTYADMADIAGVSKMIYHGRSVNIETIAFWYLYLLPVFTTCCNAAIWIRLGDFRTFLEDFSKLKFQGEDIEDELDFHPRYVKIRRKLVRACLIYSVAALFYCSAVMLWAISEIGFGDRLWSATNAIFFGLCSPLVADGFFAVSAALMTACIEDVNERIASIHQLRNATDEVHGALKNNTDPSTKTDRASPGNAVDAKHQLGVCRRRHARICLLLDRLAAAYSLWFVALFVMALISMVSSAYVTIFMMAEHRFERGSRLFAMGVFILGFRTYGVCTAAANPCLAVKSTGKALLALAESDNQREIPPDELALFHAQVLNSMPDFSAAGYFSVNKALMTAVMANFGTYLVVLLQSQSIWGNEGDMALTNCSETSSIGL